MDIKKDTERQDEIRAMKAAWEIAEPGRAAKVNFNQTCTFMLQYIYSMAVRYTGLVKCYQPPKSWHVLVA